MSDFAVDAIDAWLSRGRALLASPGSDAMFFNRKPGPMATRDIRRVVDVGDQRDQFAAVAIRDFVLDNADHVRGGGIGFGAAFRLGEQPRAVLPADLRVDQHGQVGAVG